MSGDHPRATVCGNCGATLQGTFCHVCGQKAVAADVSLHDLFHEAFHEFAHVDGKIFQTLRLLVTKPGLLTVEFLTGRRARYLSPIRLYLTCSLLFFGLAAFAPDVTKSVVRAHQTRSPGDPPLDPVAQKAWEDAASARMGRTIIHDFPRVMFVLMPAFGVLTWVIYHRARPFYAAHLYYSIHFHALVFLGLALAIPLFLLGGIGVTLARAAPVAIMAAHYIGLRRVFGGSRLQTAWKGTLIWGAYTVLVLGVMLVIGLRSMRDETSESHADGPAAAVDALHQETDSAFDLAVSRS
jgi:hypothetical protein